MGEQLEALVASYGFEYIGEIGHSHFSEDCAWDTYYHISEKCARTNTRRIVKELKSIGVAQPSRTDEESYTRILQDYLQSISNTSM